MFLCENESVLACHMINFLLTELSQSVWKNLDFDRVYRPHSLCTAAPPLTASVKIPL